MIINQIGCGWGLSAQVWGNIRGRHVIILVPNIMFTLEAFLEYFKMCTVDLEPQEKNRVFLKLHQLLQYWNNMSKEDADQVFEKNGINLS
jgi:hypothetical protein